MPLRGKLNTMSNLLFESGFSIVGDALRLHIEKKQNGQRYREPIRLKSPQFFEGLNHKKGTARRGWNVSKGACSWQCSGGIKGPRRPLDPDVTTLHMLVTRYCEILLSYSSSCKRRRATGNAERLNAITL